ncbi:hypothetical protein O9Z70_06215 [Devosia sp. YIM 151766]|uniref:hypothetical protein n=1 Tax=Devosia sp. YIM 151766 TaxID=3017325 RepID=UPI00255C689A|nr:hypothetical protein [Devosia sp. YIM 151766]WIY54111.1 hypothetical protein O9Z70_06215 [Devosia sp. YIM 151766]
MIATLSDVQYVEEAIAALDGCKNDAHLSNWSDRFCNNERYISLSEKLVRRLEDAFDKRVRWVCGVGGG